MSHRNALFAVMFSVALLRGQNPNTAVFPGAAATDTDLLVQSNQATTTLNGSINDSTLYIVLSNATDFVFPGIITIESERIKVCSKAGNILTVCVGGRGFDGSAEASHNSGVTVYSYLTRYEHNQMAAEMKAVQTRLLAALSAQVDGGAVGSESTINFLTGAGVSLVGSHPANKINVQIAADTAVLLSRVQRQAGTDLFAAPTGASGSSYSAALIPTLASYTNGMTIVFRPDVNCTGSPSTVNIDTLGAKKLFKSDGTTSLACVAGRTYLLSYSTALDSSAGAFHSVEFQ